MISQTPIIDALRHFRRSLDAVAFTSADHPPTVRFKSAAMGRQFVREMMMTTGDRRFVDRAYLRSECFLDGMAISWPPISSEPGA